MTRTWPLPRTAGGPRRTSTFFARQHSGLPPRRRVAVQERRDELLRSLSAIDRDLDRLSAERVELLEQLEQLRDVLWPVVPHWKARRPPALDRCPLPPAPAGAAVARAGDLRTLCLVLLGRNGPLALPDLHALLHRYGHVICGGHPVKALADAMRYEVAKGRAVRVARGVYDLDPDLRREGLPAWPDPPGLGSPEPWERWPAQAGGAVPDQTAGGSDWAKVPADRCERVDPARWGGDEWTTLDEATDEPRAPAEPTGTPDPPEPEPPGPPDPVPEVSAFPSHGTESTPIRSRRSGNPSRSEETPRRRTSGGGGGGIDGPGSGPDP